MEKFTQKPLCIVLIGSSSDKGLAQIILDELAAFGIEAVLRIGSAHKTPEHVLKILEEYEAREGAKAYITVAGRSNALSAFVDGAVSSPVIACPPVSEAFGGADVFSSLRLPSGVASAVVLDPKNAALFVAKVFALYDAEIAERLKLYRKANADKIIADDASLQKTV